MADLDLRFRVLARLAWLQGDITRMTDEQIARMRERGAPAFLTGRLAPEVATSDLHADGPAGPITIRTYTPPGDVSSRPVIVHFHGGGWIVGRLDQAAHICSHVAAATQAIVASVDYRLAPEHPFPAAVEDCFAALRWVAEHGDRFGGDPSRLAVMGESAGGNLAAVVSLLARDQGGPSIRHQTLTYPATDLTLASPSVEGESHHRLLPSTHLRATRDKYLGPAGDPTDWRASPLLAADHRGLPPAHIITAEHDTLRDDGTCYGDTLRAAGVPVRQTTYLGMAHGFVDITIARRVRRQAIADIAAEQVRLLGCRDTTAVTAD